MTDDEHMTRDELIERTLALIAEGDGLIAAPTLVDLREWIASSDRLLGDAWGHMDRYHRSWLMVGRPSGAVRGRPMEPEEERAYVRDVAIQKTAALRISLVAAEQGMPFVGETPGRPVD